jgi:hypothetical protein
MRESLAVTRGEFLKGGGGYPPLFFERLLPEDVACLRRQMQDRRFDSKVVFALSRRCPWGAPLVVLCVPFRRGVPFPTTFWLTCPSLRERCSQEESRQGVPSLEAFLRGWHPQWVAYHLRSSLIRLALLSEGARRFTLIHRPAAFASLRKGGVGGTRLGSAPTVKCLHLQVASWLALGEHPGEAWLRERFPLVSCSSPDLFPCLGEKRHG